MHRTEVRWLTAEPAAEESQVPVGQTDGDVWPLGEHMGLEGGDAQRR